MGRPHGRTSGAGSEPAAARRRGVSDLVREQNGAYAYPVRSIGIN